MGFFDREVENGFDRMFDMNRDGILDPAEQGLEMEFMATGKFDWEDDLKDDLDDDDDDDWEDDDDDDEW